MSNRGQRVNPMSYRDKYSPQLPRTRDFIPDGKVFLSRDLIGDKKHRDNSKKINVGSVHFVLRPVLIVAQCIALLPLYGILSNDYNDVRYEFKSVKSFCSLTMIFTSCALSVLTSYRFLEEGIGYRTIGDLMFYTASTLSMIFFFRLASSWKYIMTEWSDVEESMSDLASVNISKKINIIVTAMMSMSLCEHLLANSETLFNKGDCSGEAAHLFYVNAFRQVFTFTSFSLWKGILLSIINFIITMTWNFTDLFIMTISIVLSSRFTQINNELDTVINKDMPLEYWRKTREMYNKLSLLTKVVDKKISLIVFLSFTNNLYFICLQLLNSLKPIQSTSKAIYFFTSFSHLLFRTCAVCFTASNIYDNSKQPLAALFSVPSATYNIEVQRLLMQVSFDTLALTGCKFFAITRTLMLTVAGTIVTYEIVLVQFNALTNDGINTDKTVVCPTPN